MTQAADALQDRPRGRLHPPRHLPAKLRLHQGRHVAQADRLRPHRAGPQGVQQPGIRTGTPNYMAPEVVRRKPTDQRLDIFAFGVSMYEMFAFELPWQRGSGDGLAAMGHGQSKPPPLDKHYPKIHPDAARRDPQVHGAGAGEAIPVDEAVAQRHPQREARGREVIANVDFGLRIATSVAIRQSESESLLSETSHGRPRRRSPPSSPQSRCSSGASSSGAPCSNMTGKLMAPLPAEAELDVLAAARGAARRPTACTSIPGPLPTRATTTAAEGVGEEDRRGAHLPHGLPPQRHVADGPGDVRQGAGPQLRHRPARRACCWRWSPDALPSYASRVARAACWSSLIAAIWTNVGNVIWWFHTPQYAAGQMAYTLVAGLLMALITAAIVRPRASDAQRMIGRSLPGPIAGPPAAVKCRARLDPTARRITCTHHRHHAVRAERASETLAMTIDKSLKVRRGATSSRSVLTRAERLERLKETERWKEGDSPLGLPKVRVRKLAMKKKKKKAKEGEEGAAAQPLPRPAAAPSRCGGKGGRR